MTDGGIERLPSSLGAVEPHCFQVVWSRRSASLEIMALPPYDRLQRGRRRAAVFTDTYPRDSSTQLVKVQKHVGPAGRAIRNHSNSR